MTDEFLTWFLSQKPFRKSRLVMKNGFERFIDKPEYIAFIGNGKVLIGPDLGLGRLTVNLEEVEEIRQS